PPPYPCHRPAVGHHVASTRAWYRPPRRPPRPAAPPARDQWAPQPHRLTRHARARVEARTGPLPGRKRRVRNQGHFVGLGVVAREPHLLPGHEAARELLNAGEAAREVDVGRDRLGEPLDEL